MSWAKRIDNRNYTIGTAANIGIAVFLGLPSLSSVLTLVYVVIGAFLNQYYTIKVFERLIKRSEFTDSAPGKGPLFIHIFLKIFFLISAFVCLMVFNRDKVLYGLLGYTFQLIILFLSIKNIGQFFKKGTPS